MRGETHVSLFDGSNAGCELTDKPAFSVQYHPEASPGPQDSYLSVRASSWGCWSERLPLELADHDALLRCSQTMRESMSRPVGIARPSDASIG